VCVCALSTSPAVAHDMCLVVRLGDCYFYKFWNFAYFWPFSRLGIVCVGTVLEKNLGFQTAVCKLWDPGTFMNSTLKLSCPVSSSAGQLKSRPMFMKIGILVCCLLSVVRESHHGCRCNG